MGNTGAALLRACAALLRACAALLRKSPDIVAAVVAMVVFAVLAAVIFDKRQAGRLQSGMATNGTCWCG